MYEAEVEVDESLSVKTNRRKTKQTKKIIILFHSRKLSCAETDFTLAPLCLAMTNRLLRVLIFPMEQ